MSNRIYLTRTRFEGYDGISWGWRLTDDFFSSFSCGYKEEDVSIKPFDLLNQVVIEAIDTAPSALELFTYALHHEKGCYIDGVYFPSKEITPILKKALK